MSFCSHCTLPSKGGGKDGKVVCSYGCVIGEQMGRRKIPLLRLGGGILACLVSLFISTSTFSLGGHEKIFQIALVTFGLAIIGLPWVYFLISQPSQPSARLGDAALLSLLIYDYLTSITSLFFSIQYPPLFLSRPFAGASLLLITLPLIGLLASWLQKRSTLDIRILFNLRPKTAHLLVKNQVSKISISELKVGDQIQVNAGEVIPADGQIILGTTSVDETVLTAEKTILFKEKGDLVVGGSLNRDATILIGLQTPPEEHFLPKVALILQNSLTAGIGFSKTIFILPLVIGLSIVAIYSHSYYSALSLVLVFFGFAARIRFFSMLSSRAIGGAIRNGIVLKQANALKHLARINTLFFGKTGTLTFGRFYHSEQFVERGTDEGLFLSAIFSLESASNHPLATGMATHPWYLEVPRLAVKDFKSYPGLGVSGLVSERGGEEVFVAVGNQRFLKRQQMQISRGLREKIDELEQVGETVILCGWGGGVKGILSFADNLRSDVKPFLSRLTALKVKPILITGDHDEMCAHLTHTSGLSQIYTRCLPEEKGSKIQNRRQKKDVVGMMGSSVDEETAFRQSDVGIMIGTGTRLVETSASVSILGKSLVKVVLLIDSARRVAAEVRWGAYLTTLGGLIVLLLRVL